MEKKILIIGAGASGVAAATKLLSNGFKNVTILEAENRFGGRINTIPYGANVVDLGAQWCHGEKNNVVYEMANEKGLLDSSEHLYDNMNYVRSNGETLSDDLTTKLNILFERLCEGEEYEQEKKRFRGSTGNFVADKFKEVLKTEDFKDVSPELAHEIFELFGRAVNALEGVNSWFELSTNPHEYEVCEGNFNLNWKDKGYITVFDLLQNKIPEGKGNQQVIDVIPLIQFNKTVSKITYNQPDHTIKVECEDGSSYSADHLICTVSLGVLKERHLNLFEPILPLDKINTIDGLMIGTVDKIYLEFDKPFWTDGRKSTSCLWRPEEVKETRKDPVNGDWMFGIQGLMQPNSRQPNLVCCWITGNPAQKMEQKSDADAKAGAEKVVRMFFGDQIPNVKSSVRSTWNSNPHFRGSYTCYTLKADALDACIRKLATPIRDANGKPIVQFAGEATSHNHYSCVHGAIDSGIREANRLIELYK